MANAGTTAPPPPPRPERSARPLYGALGLLGALFAVVCLRYRPPAPKDLTAPSNTFSAARARAILTELLPEGVPHPAGSPANARMRKRIIAHLESLGYQPTVQSGFTCNSRGACAYVTNIVARLPGREDLPAVMLTSHYDSVPAGPGASDDLAAVASTLEIARILRAEGPHRRPIMLLMADGEEAGLIGAQAFVNAHPAAEDVWAVVNLEARGTSGPSMLFETSNDNAWLVDLFADVAHRPKANSMSYTIYKMLPNNTDFSVFREAGYVGVNFGFIGDVVRYHTPLDSVVNTDPGSLQHHGDNALTAVRALADADDHRPQPGDAVYFDVLGLTIVTWPEVWTVPLAAVALALVALALGTLFRSHALSARAFIVGVAAWPAMVGAAAGAGYAVTWLLATARGVGDPWTAEPLPALVAVLGATAVAVRFTLTVLQRWLTPWSLWAGTWTWLALAAMALGAFLPGLSFPFLVPALVAGAAMAPAGARRDATWNGRADAATIAAALATGLFWFATGRALFDTFGLGFSAALAALFAVVLTTLTPLAFNAPTRTHQVQVGATAMVVVIATAVALRVPAFSVTAPRHLNVQLYQDATAGTARWLVSVRSGAPPRPMQEAAGLGDTPVRPAAFLGVRGTTYAGPAPAIDTAPPAATVLADEPTAQGRRLKLHVGSPRGASTISLAWPAATQVRRLLLNGQPMRNAKGEIGRVVKGWHMVRCMAVPPAGIELDFDVATANPFDLVVVDESSGLPEAGAAILRARPATVAPVHRGDRTLISRRFTL